MTYLLPPAIRRQVMNLEAIIGHYTRHPAPWSNDVVTNARCEIAEIYEREDVRAIMTIAGRAQIALARIVATHGATT